MQSNYEYHIAKHPLAVSRGSFGDLITGSSSDLNSSLLHLPKQINIQWHIVGRSFLQRRDRTGIYRFPY